VEEDLALILEEVLRGLESGIREDTKLPFLDQEAWEGKRFRHDEEKASTR